ncbi:prephenate dehydrogenase [Sulfobacillus thermosulfidooxidans]|uniref:prephenate dehydrogenase n=1 Tax=Sulfobacillus thermosulfidooxidans TaxID=28034 RepID=UPI0002F367BF|nr:prephenate dehydrogenase [Sulfobacillus thermosulfidooxidans]
MRVGVIGLGLIGGSVAKACLKAGWTVYAYDVNSRVIEQARVEGIIVDTTWEQWIQDIDQIVLATPLNDVAIWIPRILAHARAGCTIVDMSSVKGIFQSVYAQIQPPFALLSLHPMAGKEVRGFEHSDSRLFEGRSCLIVEVEGIALDPHLVQQWMTVLGSRPVWVPWDQHDALMSLVSHTPYLISAAVLTLAKNADNTLPLWPQVVGTGFLDVTRIGASDERLWKEILKANESHIRETFAQFTQLIHEWNDQIQRGEWPKALKDTASIRNRAVSNVPPPSSPTNG